jgi:hypothetical protein
MAVEEFLCKLVQTRKLWSHIRIWCSCSFILISYVLLFHSSFVFSRCQNKLIVELRCYTQSITTMGFVNGAASCYTVLIRDVSESATACTATVAFPAILQSCFLYNNLIYSKIWSFHGNWSWSSLLGLPAVSVKNYRRFGDHLCPLKRR